MLHVYRRTKFDNYVHEHFVFISRPVDREAAYFTKRGTGEVGRVGEEAGPTLESACTVSYQYNATNMGFLSSPIVY